MSTPIPCIGGPLDGNGFTPGGDRRPCPLGYELVEFQGMPFFVADTMGFLEARREMRRLWHAATSEGAAVPLGSPEAVEYLRREANLLVHSAMMYGIVLTITQRPLQPLGMAHYETVVEVRPVQVPT